MTKFEDTPDQTPRSLSDEEIEGTRAKLLSTALEGAILFNQTISVINFNRDKHHIPIIDELEYVERATDWLTDERVASAALLPENSDQPRLIIPKLHRPISKRETMVCWSDLSLNGTIGIERNLELLSPWSDDELSGYNPEAEDEIGFSVTPTAYDKSREAEYMVQLDSKPAGLDVATIFDGAVIARRYRGFTTEQNTSSVVSIDLSPEAICTTGTAVLCLPAARLNTSVAYVGPAVLHNIDAARLQVR